MLKSKFSDMEVGSKFRLLTRIRSGFSVLDRKAIVSVWAKATKKVGVGCEPMSFTNYWGYNSSLVELVQMPHSTEFFDIF